MGLKKWLFGLFLLSSFAVSGAEFFKKSVINSTEGQALSVSSTIKVVTTFSVLSDLVRQIGGGKVQVHSLVGMDENAHVYNPSARDVRRVANSDLLVVNGLGFEGWLDRMVDAAKYKGSVVTASKGVHAIALEPGAHDEHRQHKEHQHHLQQNLQQHQVNRQDALVRADSVVYDPHAWHSIPAVKIYIKNITRALQKIDTKNIDFYQKNMEHYLSRLDEFQKKVLKRMAAIPSGRHIVMPHNAFAYLARDYNLNIHSLQGLSAEAETSAAQITSVIRQVRKFNIQAIFAENISDERLIKLVQRETGVKIGGALITGALSKKLAPSYLEMMTYNTNLIIKALTPSN